MLLFLSVWCAIGECDMSMTVKCELLARVGLGALLTVMPMAMAWASASASAY